MLNKVSNSETNKVFVNKKGIFTDVNVNHKLNTDPNPLFVSIGMSV